MKAESGKLRFVERMGYGFGDMASCLFWQTFSMFLLFFYTDIFGITAAAAGTMFLVTRIWDTLFDPLMGIVADRTTTRWGKFRPYLLWMCVPLGLTAILTFTTPGLTPTGKLVYAYVTYTMLMLLYSCINVPYGALMGVMTPNSQERTVLSTFRFIGAFTGGLIVQFSTLSLVQFFGHGNSAKGYQLAMVVYAILAVILFLGTFSLTKERVVPLQDKRASLKADVKDLLHNVPWLIVVGSTIFACGFSAIRNSAIIYYFKYYVLQESRASWYMVLGSLMAVTGIILMQFITPMIGKKKAYIGLMLGATVLSVLSYWVGPEQFLWMYAFQILINLIKEPTAPLLWPLYADTADYSESKTGRRATGLIFSASGMSQKFGWAIGGSFTGWLLAYFAFTPNVAQSAETQNGIRLMMSIVPAICSLAAAILMFFYPLNEAKVKKIEEELKVARAARG
jgi:GPH family glycoside/pentoside/hexuronide:cation symporter